MRSHHCRRLCRALLMLGALMLLVCPRVGARPIPPGQVGGPCPTSSGLLPAAQEGAPHSPPLPPLSPETLGKFEPALLKQLLQGHDPRVRLIVRLAEQTDLSRAAMASGSLARRRAVVEALQRAAESSQIGVRAFLAQEEAAGRATGVRPFWIFDGLALTSSRETAFALAAREEVTSLRLDHQQRLPDLLGEADAEATGPRPQDVEWNITRIQAPLVWDALGFDGTGVVIGHVDSGVDWLHPALRARYRGYDPHGVAHQHAGNWFDATGDGAAYPVDGNGHGTHTMGTMAGQEGIGVAPGARWIAARAFNSLGIGYDSWIHAAYEWLLAPLGDPSLAPDVVNNSWSHATSSYEEYREDVRALRAAGILAVFSAGNSGPGGGTIGAPASYPEALAVGATDQTDQVASFSGRGPSPWGQVKPDLVAPGTYVRSSVPGGSYASYRGTSMAAPHVAGVLALMLQADATLTITDAGQVITSTAMPLPASGSVPNNDYGWGRVDAYAAVAAVAARAIVSGVVTSGSDGTALSQAVVSATPADGGTTVQTSTDAHGRYAVALRPGTWELTASAFGYEPDLSGRMELVTGTVRVLHFALAPVATGTLSGTVLEEGTGTPLSATLAAAGTPALATTDPTSGRYSLSLPSGIYTISVRSEGHRVVGTPSVPITAGQTTIRSFSLMTAPTILLVDSGAWYYGSQIGYYEDALDDLDYLYDVRVIACPPGDVPTADDLTPYDIVIWSAPDDAPGYVGASLAITSYLESNGRLLLSGQDVAFWDAGGSGTTFFPYFRDYLYASFVADDASTRSLAGQTGDLFEGLEFCIDGAGGAANQTHPDVIEASDPGFATPVLVYDSDGSAAQRVGLCRPYRALYLAFGFETIDGEALRREVMQRAIDWVTSPRPEWGVELREETRPTQIGLPGQSVTHCVRLRNTGERQPSDTYDLTVECSKGWTHALSDSTLSIASCAVVSLTLTVDIPPTAGWDEAEVITVTAKSQGDPTQVDSVTLRSKSPAPVLLVDDDRWYDQEDRYQSALDERGYRHDLWDVEDRGWTTPPTDTLAMYPMVVWYTASDWHEPLSPADEGRLAHYLDGGGRLFFSGQDYLYANGLTDLGRDYFGLAGYGEDVTSTVSFGINGNPVGDHLGALALHYPINNWSDALEPVQQADGAFAGQHGAIIGVAHAGEGHKAVFLGFPFEALAADDRATVMERVIGWLSWLGDSAFHVDETLASSGQTLTYTLGLRNDGGADVNLVAVTNTLPISLTFVPGSLTGPGASYLDGAVLWQGPVAQGGEVALTYQAQLTGSLTTGDLIRNCAQFHLVDQGVAFTRTARTRADAPELSASMLIVDRAAACPGEALTYTLVVRNDGFSDAPSAWVTNPVPVYTTYVSGSLVLDGDGVAGAANGTITWTGALPHHQAVTLTYRAVIGDAARHNVLSRAWLGDGYGEVWEKVAQTFVRYFKYRLFPVFRHFAGD